MLSSMISQLSGFLMNYIPLVLAILAGLIGLGVMMHYTKQHVVGSTGFKKTVYIKGVSQQKNGYISVDY